MGKLQGSLKVTRCDSRGWKSKCMTLKVRICFCAVCERSNRSLRGAAGTVPGQYRRSSGVRVAAYMLSISKKRPCTSDVRSLT